MTSTIPRAPTRRRRQWLAAALGLCASRWTGAHGTAAAHAAPPGRRGETVWTFNRPGDFEFACLIAGHPQAGMKGTIRVIDIPPGGS